MSEKNTCAYYSGTHARLQGASAIFMIIGQSPLQLPTSRVRQYRSFLFVFTLIFILGS